MSKSHLGPIGFPLRHRPLCGGFAEAIERAQVAHSNLELREQLGVPTDMTITSTLYDPEPDTRCGWDETWLLSDSVTGNTLAYADRRLPANTADRTWADHEAEYGVVVDQLPTGCQIYCETHSYAHANRVAERLVEEGDLHGFLLRRDVVKCGNMYYVIEGEENG